MQRIDDSCIIIACCKAVACGYQRRVSAHSTRCCLWCTMLRCGALQLTSEELPAGRGGATSACCGRAGRRRCFSSNLCQCLCKVTGGLFGGSRGNASESGAPSRLATQLAFRTALKPSSKTWASDSLRRSTSSCRRLLSAVSESTRWYVVDSVTSCSCVCVRVG